MPWILLLLAILCFGVTFMSNIPFAATLILLLLALVFLVGFILSFLAQRMESNRRDDSRIISPEELRMMREQAAARKAANNADDKPTAQ